MTILIRNLILSFIITVIILESKSTEQINLIQESIIDKKPQHRKTYIDPSDREIQFIYDQPVLVCTDQPTLVCRKLPENFKEEIPLIIRIETNKRDNNYMENTYNVYKKHYINEQKQEDYIIIKETINLYNEGFTKYCD